MTMAVMLMRFTVFIMGLTCWKERPLHNDHGGADGV